MSPKSKIMSVEPVLHYFCKPSVARTTLPVEFVTVQELLTDEAACKVIWELLSKQFRTRSKFLAVWPSVRFVALHRDKDGLVDGFLLVTSAINWQIDYVVVRPESRGQGIATALVTTAVNRAYLHKVPYVMLTSNESLRPLYEACGFEVVKDPCPV
jgi:ribosomal protein S18 acetylase RimI-like enzyme